MKKNLLLTLLLCMALLLCACGSTGSKKEDKDKKDPGNSSENQTQDPADPQDPSGDLDPVGQGDSKDPFSIKVDGTQYTFSAKNGIENFASMPGVGFIINAGTALERDYRARFLSNGEMTEENHEVSELRCNVQNFNELPTMTYFSKKGIISCDNGYLLSGGIDFSNVTASRYPNTPLDFCAYRFSFLNDYSYMGITPGSSVSDILNAGFYPGYFPDCYYNVYTSKGVSYEECEKDYEEFVTRKIPHVLIQKGDPSETFAYVNEYRLGMTLSPFDYAMFDLGFSKDAEENYRPSGNVTATMYKDLRVQALQIGKAIQQLNNEEIDYFILVDVFSKDSKLAKLGENVLNITFFVKSDLIKKWPENWGWNPAE